MAKGRATRDATSDESCNKMREQRGKGDKTKPTNRGTVLELWKHKSHITKSQILKTKTSRDINGKPMTGKITSKTINSDPIQGDAISNISQNLRKKGASSIDWNSLQCREKQLHNWELINPIYNKYQIISQDKKARKNKSAEVSCFPMTVRSTTHWKGKQNT